MGSMALKLGIETDFWNTLTSGRQVGTYSACAVERQVIGALPPDRDGRPKVSFGRPGVAGPRNPSARCQSIAARQAFRTSVS